MPSGHRTPRASLFPSGYAVRLAAMIGALILIGATILNMRARAGAANAPRAANKADQEWKETIVPAPADEDPIEMDEARRLFEGVFDKHALVESDMPAYWRLMKWARSLSFAELEERARRDVPFTKLWEHPDSHRGELIRLRLHVRRVVEHDNLSQNSAGLATVYEISGVTDESKTNPYVVVCFELPPEVPVGTDTYAEVVFVGYFLKIWAYSGGDEKNRGAPFLIGRVKAVTSGKSLAEARTDGLLAMVAIGVAIVLAALVAVALWRLARGKRRGPLTSAAVPTLPNADIEAWLENPVSADEGAEPSHAAPSTNGASHLDG